MKLQQDERPSAMSLLAVLCLALVLRCGGAWWWQARLPGEASFALGDSESYWSLGRSLAEGRPYTFPDARFRVFRAPGYPVFLAILFLVWSDGVPPVIVVRLAGAFLGTLVVFQVWRLGNRLYGSRVGSIGAFLASVYPGAIAMSILVLSESLFVPLMLAAALSWSRASDAAGLRRVAVWAGTAGLWSGLAALTRPSWLLFVPMACMAACLDRRMSFPQRITLVAGTLAAMVTVTAPWWVRNARLTGHFVPTTLQVGASLYDGWNPRANGGSNMSFAPAFRQRVEQDRRRRPGESLDDFEWELDRAYRRAAWEWAWNNPRRAGRLGLAKLRRTWQPWPQGELLGGSTAARIVSLGYMTIFAFGLVGLIRNWRRGWVHRLPLLYAVTTALLHMVFVGSIRYRQPAMVWWTAPAAWALWCGVTRFTGKTHRRAVRQRGEHEPS